MTPTAACLPKVTDWARKGEQDSWTLGCTRPQSPVCLISVTTVDRYCVPGHMERWSLIRFVCTGVRFVCSRVRFVCSQVRFVCSRVQFVCTGVWFVCTRVHCDFCCILCAACLTGGKFTSTQNSSPRGKQSNKIINQRPGRAH